MKSSAEIQTENVKRVIRFLLVFTAIFLFFVNLDIQHEKKEMDEFITSKKVAKELYQFFGPGYDVVGVKKSNFATKEFKLYVSHVGEKFIITYKNEELQKIDYNFDCISFKDKGKTRQKCYFKTIYQR